MRVIGNVSTSRHSAGCRDGSEAVSPAPSSSWARPKLLHRADGLTRDLHSLGAPEGCRRDLWAHGLALAGYFAPNLLLGLTRPKPTQPEGIGLRTKSSIPSRVTADPTQGLPGGAQPGLAEGSPSRAQARGRAEMLQQRLPSGVPCAWGSCSPRDPGDSGTVGRVETLAAQVGLRGGHGCMSLKLHSEKVSWLVRKVLASIFSKHTNIGRSKEQKGGKEKTA